jgi:hypothetical protein
MDNIDPQGRCPSVFIVENGVGKELLEAGDVAVCDVIGNLRFMKRPRRIPQLFNLS